jgi:CRP-like cAMP-binding protein
MTLAAQSLATESSHEGHAPRRNRLLAALPDESYHRLVSESDVVMLRSKETIYRPSEPIEHVYFPVTAVISVFTVMENGSTVEVGAVGSDGMAGLPVFLGADSMPVHAIAQIAGAAVRVPAFALRRAVERDRPLRDLLGRYTQALLTQFGQSAACNRLHSVEARCARWLLTTHDRVRDEQFRVTQEVLAQILGVRRASVSGAAATLRRSGVIQYRRGKITIVDRDALERAACECHRVISLEFDRVLGWARDGPATWPAENGKES